MVISKTTGVSHQATRTKHIDSGVHLNGKARLTDGRVVHEGGRDSAVCSKSTHMTFQRPCYHSGSQRIFGVLIVVASGVRERKSQRWRAACDSPTDLGSPPGKTHLTRTAGDHGGCPGVINLKHRPFSA